MECDICKNSSGGRNSNFTCDCCNGKYCKTCANLKSSEIKVLELKESRVLKFICMKCEKFEAHTLLLKTIEDKHNLIQAKEEIITLLKKKIDELENSQVVNLEQQFSYSQITQKEQRTAPGANINLPSIIIKPKKQQTIEKTEAEVKKYIKPSDLKIAIKNTRGIKNGGILINYQ